MKEDKERTTDGSFPIIYICKVCGYGYDKLDCPEDKICIYCRVHLVKVEVGSMKASRNFQNWPKDQEADWFEMFRNHTHNLDTHSRALAAHCECLAMNAENCFIMQIRPSDTIPYSADSYFKVMEKWGLINEKGEPLI